VAPDAGLFAPGSVFRRVNRETVLLLGGPRALLLQLAHPLVAAGVAAHSDFLRHPLRRLWRTVDTMLRIVFGDRQTAHDAARGLNEVHGRVRGTLAEATAHFPAGTPYDARDPALLLWVHATLVDAALVTYECFVAPLDVPARAGFYEDSKIVARLLGVPDEELPPTPAAFAAYVRETIAGPVLEITPTARRLADAVLHPPLPLVPRLAGDLGSVVALALLPEPIRARYGFVWDWKRDRAWSAVRTIVQRALPLLPEVLRVMPHARAAGPLC
jgi:uncharacterized protein (DUF2236 family)